MRELMRWMATGLSILALVLSAAARADFIPIPLPDATYLSGTTRIDITAADFDVVTSLSDGVEDVAFDIGMVALTVPTTWGTWGSPPNTESSTPRVLWTNGFPSLSMTLAVPVFTFGFEAEPNVQFPANLTASFFHSGILVGSISIDVDGNGGARLFAATTSTQPFDAVLLVSTDDFAIANLRYALAQVAPEPESLALVLLGGALMVALRRWKRPPKADALSG